MNASKVRTLLALSTLIAVASIATGAWGTLFLFAPERAFSLVVLLVPWGAVLAYSMVAVPDLCSGFEMEIEDDELALIREHREHAG